MSSPCRTCPRRNADKNHPACINCQKRLSYIACLDRDRFVGCTRSGADPFAVPAGSFPRRSHRGLTTE